MSFTDREELEAAGLRMFESGPTGRTGADWEEYWEKTYGPEAP